MQHFRISAAGAALLFVAALPIQVRAQEGLNRFVDLKCYAITGDPLNVDMRLDHLNPVFQQLGLAPEFVTMLDPVELCVPVFKNEQMPPTDIVRVLQYIDLKCYNITGDPLGIDLRLDHINPLLTTTLPPLFVNVQNPQKLCVPVAKNGMQIPPDVLRIVQYVDQKCYNIAGAPIQLPLRLDHLNPLFRAMGLPTESVVVQDPQQLCVPVVKNQQPIPADVLPIVSSIDMTCYGIQAPPTSFLRLDHLNPALQPPVANPEFIFTLQPVQLCLPVRKSVPGPGATPDAAASESGGSPLLALW